MSIQETKVTNSVEILNLDDNDQEDESNDSLSLGECRLLMNEETKRALECEKSTDLDGEGRKKWWLKKPGSKLEVVSSKRSENKIRSDNTPSMKEFLERENMCKNTQRSELVEKNKDDTLCEILASTAFGKYASDLENATDDDIGSFLEEMSKIAGALSPNSAPEPTKSGESSKTQTEEEKSVEELLEEAEKLVKENSGLSKSISRSETFVPDDESDDDNSKSSNNKLEVNIFRLIEQQVHKETEKIRKSPNKNGRKFSPSPDYEFTYDKMECLKPPKSLQLQKKKFDEQKVEVSSSSDLDDPIERHSKSEDLKSLKKAAEDKENLRKEITDVDKNFFDDLLRKSKEQADGKISQSSSLGQEDFSQFLKILQNQSDKQDNISQTFAPINGTMDSINDPLSAHLNDPNNASAFPEKEISEILERELIKVQDTNEIDSDCDKRDRESDKNRDKSRDSDSDKDIKTSNSDKMLKNLGNKVARKSKKLEKTQANYLQQEAKKIAASPSELYTVGLTPRLELFADAIPKLIAERSNENSNSRKKSSDDNFNEKDKDEKNKAGDEAFNVNTNSDIFSSNQLNKMAVSLPNTSKNDQTTLKNSNKKSSKLPGKKTANKSGSLGPSRSCDQLSKPVSTFRSSLDDVRNPKSAETLKKPSHNLAKTPGVVVKASFGDKKNPLQNILSSKMKINSKPVIKKVSSVNLKASSSREKNENAVVKHLIDVVGETSKRQSQIGKNEWEILYHEERHKNVLLKNQIESEARIYKQQMDGMRVSFEEELFALKRHNMILNDKIDQLALNSKKDLHVDAINTHAETQIVLLNKELKKQDGMIQTYETENKRLMEENKKLLEDVKKVEASTANKISKNQDHTAKIEQLNDVVKDLKEEIVKLNFIVSDLRQKNNDINAKNDDMLQQNSLLQEELMMFKEQLKTKDKFITDKLRAMSQEEMEMRRKMEAMQKELKSKTEKLKITNEEFDKFHQAVVPLEKELLELRTKEKTLLDKLQISRSHVEREKVLTQKLKDQVILDNKKILDLNRQVREMERILKRKNPDSVSAVMLAAKSNGSYENKISIDKIMHLEERIASLEGELSAKEEINNEKLTEAQNKYREMEKKYSSQVAELETKLIEALKKEKIKIVQDYSTQTDFRNCENKNGERHSPSEREDKRDDRKRDVGNKAGPKSQNYKEDAHLLATIRGLKLELISKDKTIVKMSKEIQELQKTIRKLTRDRERNINERKSLRVGDINEIKTKVSTHNKNDNDQNSNVYQNGHIESHSKLSGSSQKLYDPLQFSENGESSTLKRLSDENEILKEELCKMNKDFMSLKNKRLYDLNLLQEEHEREVASLIKEYSIKFGDSKVVKLQGQINNQMALISHLKQQIETLRDYKEQVIVLKVEREHLENKVKIMNDKVKYLSTPGTEQLQLLQDKITVLQQRHESREMTLQNLVRELLRSKNQCKDCSRGESRDKDRELCYYRQELDHILGMLQEIANVS